MATDALISVRQEVLETFKRDGIASVRFQDLFGEELWEAANADIAPFVEEASARDFGDAPKKKEEVIVRRFYVPDGNELPRFGIGEPWLRYVASDTTLDIVNGYLESESRLFYLDNWFTVPYPAAEGRVASQRWHRDPEDDHIVKVFVYFSDVDEGSGPFEYVKSSAAGGKYGDVFAWREGFRYPDSDELEARVDPTDVVTMTGPAGTMLFVDTAGYHRGGFAKTKPRILSIASFLRPDAKKMGKRRFEIDFEGREGDLSEQARTALS